MLLPACQMLVLFTRVPWFRSWPKLRVVEAPWQSVSSPPHRLILNLLETPAVNFPQLSWVLALLLGCSSLGIAGEPKVVSRIAFGSCAKQDRPQPIWDAISQTQPHAFLFLGDNIYADTEDPEVMRNKYRQLGEQPGYQRLRTICPVYATWDDHDYGVNDGGADYPQKRVSQQIFLEFFQVPQADPRWTREGVYSASLLGPPGRRLQIILLDTRYFRSPLRKGFQRGEAGEGVQGVYLPQTDPSTTLLGATQWKWLEEQLRQPAEIRLIGSSIQVVPNEHGWELWGNFPHERRRLFDLIRQTQASGVIFLSGDRHLAEISRLPVDRENSVPYPLFDVTSSSLNTPSGSFTKARTRFINEINSHRLGLTYFETNFGLIDIDWNASDPMVRMQIRDEAGEVVLQQRVKLSQLRATE